MNYKENWKEIIICILILLNGALIYHVCDLSEEVKSMKSDISSLYSDVDYTKASLEAKSALLRSHKEAIDELDERVNYLEQMQLLRGYR